VSKRDYLNLSESQEGFIGLLEAGQMALESIADPDVFRSLYDTVVNVFMRNIGYKQFIDTISPESWAKGQACHVITRNWGANVKATDLIADYLPDVGSKILDLGCNDGALVRKLTEMGYDCYGVDLPEVIEKARDMYPDSADRLSVCNLETDELSSDSYDFVLALAVIEHLKRYDLLLDKIAKVLKPQGILYLTTSNREYREIDVWHTHHFTVEELSKLANWVGLKPLKYKRVDSRTNLTGIFERT